MNEQQQIENALLDAHKHLNATYKRLFYSTVIDKANKRLIGNCHYLQWEPDNTVTLYCSYPFPPNGPLKVPSGAAFVEPGKVLTLTREGDYYIALGNDAKVIAKVLEIVLTSRKVSEKERVALVGLPYHRLDDDVATLSAAGYTINIQE